LQIFNIISNSKPDKKLDKINEHKKEMRELDAAIIAQDKYIKQMAT
jgi:hypothetical protein